MNEPALDAETEIEETDDEAIETPDDDTTGEETPTTETPDSVEGDEGKETPATDEAAETAEPVLTLEEREAKVKKDEARVFFQRRQLEKERAAIPAPVKTVPAAKPAPKEEDFEDYEAYQDAKIEWKLDQRDAAREAEEAKRAEQVKTGAYNEKMMKAAENSRHADFIEVVTNKDLPISVYSVDAIIESEEPAEIQYYLGTHLEEAYRITQLSPAKQIMEIAKIEQRIIAAKPKQKIESKSPGATKPISGKGSLAKEDKDLSTEEWIKKRNAAEGVE